MTGFGGCWPTALTDGKAFLIGSCVHPRGRLAAMRDSFTGALILPPSSPAVHDRATGRLIPVKRSRAAADRPSDGIHMFVFTVRQDGWPQALQTGNSLPG